MQGSQFQKPPRKHRVQRKPKTMRSGYAHGMNPHTVIHPIRACVNLLVKIAVSLGKGKPQLDPAQGFILASQLPKLDFAAANPYWVRELAGHLDVIVGLCQNGAKALGHLLAVASAELEGGEISGDTVEGLGWLLSELGDMGAWATVMSQSCKAATADFCPTENEAAR
jgi:hypothetical protein